jgi:hypothetical protein
MKNMRGVAALLAAATHEKTEFVVAGAGQPQRERWPNFWHISLIAVWILF